MSKLKAVTDYKLSRRTFLKATGALGGALALEAGQASLLTKTDHVASAAPAEEQIISTWCQQCAPNSTTCSILCHIVDGRWVRVEGNPYAANNGARGRTSLCVKGNTGMQELYAPERLKYPLKRVGEKGEGKFTRITWDEALSTIANKLNELKEKYGPECYAQLIPSGTPICKPLGRRFLSCYGSPNFCHSAICATPRSRSTQLCIGAASTSPGQMDKTALLVVWGKNPENSSVNTGGAIEILDNVARGMKYIDIRPMQNNLGSKADIWLGIRPGTDGALALGILNVIINEKLYDSDFVSQWCHGFEELAEFVQQHTPEWAAEQTGIPAEKIVEVARMMATIKPMGIMSGNGIADQANDGTQQAWAIALITAITGNLDVPGGGGASWSWPSLTRFSKNVDYLLDRLPLTEEDEQKGYPAGVSKLVAPELPRWFQGPGHWESGPHSAYFKALMSILTEKPYPLRAVVAPSTSPLSATRQPKRVAEALKKLEFFFMIDPYWTPSMDYADIVLPACTWYECSDLVGTQNVAEGTFIQILQKVAEPLGDTRSDTQIWLDLGCAMGWEEDWWNGDADASLRERLETSKTGFTLEELRAAPRGIFIERTDPRPPEPEYRQYAKLFQECPEGKVQCYNEWAGGKPNADETGTLPYLPTYTGPPESIAGTPELAKDYPLVISDVHCHPLSQHGMHMNIPYAREIMPDPWAMVNPATAKKYGIGNGDWMKVESPHGWVVYRAVYLEGIAPDVLMTKRGNHGACEELNVPGYSVFDGGSEANVLYNTDETLFCGFCSQMAKQTLVKISKSPEPPKTVGGITIV